MDKLNTPLGRAGERRILNEAIGNLSMIFLREG